MKCANCGNDNSKTLWNEGDTVYCSVCCHRTRRDTEKDDLIICPHCGMKRDRKAMTCWWCGSYINDNTPIDKKERKILDNYRQKFVNQENITHYRIKDC